MHGAHLQFGETPLHRAAGVIMDTRRATKPSVQHVAVVQQLLAAGSNPYARCFVSVVQALNLHELGLVLAGWSNTPTMGTWRGAYRCGASAAICRSIPMTLGRHLSTIRWPDQLVLPMRSGRSRQPCDCARRFVVAVRGSKRN